MENCTKKNALVFMINQNMVFALGSILVNLEKINHHYPIDIKVVHSDLTTKDIEIFKKVNFNIEFILYTLEDFKKEHNITNTSKNLSNFINRFSHLSLVKYKALKFLDNYTSVLLMDVDTLILKDISILFDLKDVAWRNGDSLHTKISRNEQLENLENYLNFTNDKTTAPNGGFLYFSNNIPYKKMLEYCREETAKNIQKYSACLDEIVIALAINKFKINLHELDGTEWNVLPKFCNPKTRVVHFVGKKIWDSPEMSVVYPEWQKYYEEWCEITQHEKKFNILDRGTILRNFENDKYWSNILTKLSPPKGWYFNYDRSKTWLHMYQNETNYKNKIYFELFMTSESQEVGIGFWLRDEIFLNNSECIEIAKMISKNKPFINYRHDNKYGIFLFISKVKIIELDFKLNIFHRIIKEAFNTYL